MKKIIKLIILLCSITAFLYAEDSYVNIYSGSYMTLTSADDDNSYIINSGSGDGEINVNSGGSFTYWASDALIDFSISGDGNIEIPVTPVQNSCLDFDGNNDLVNCGTINLSYTQLTFECWIKVDFFQSSSPYITSLMGEEGTDNSALLRIGDASLDNDKVQFVLDLGSGQVKLDGSQKLETNTWYHIAGVYNSSTGMIIYINGEIDVSNSASGTIRSNATFFLGTNEGVERFINGSMDEIRVWNIARTQNQIQDNMNNELVGNEVGLVAYYKLNSGSGQVAIDFAGENDATLGNNSGADSADPTWISSDAPLPVTLSSFTAAYINSASTLSWTTQSENSNLGWNIYRSETEEFAAGSVQNADLIEGAGTTTEPTDYTFSDPYPAVAGSSYWFWIESISFSGDSEIYGPVSLSVPNTEPGQNTPIIPETFGLYQNYPNPFNPTTKISFALEEAGGCELMIYDVKGRKIKTLFIGNIEADRVYNFIWDGDDESNKPVSSGIYYYKMKAGKYSSVKKMILLK